MIGGKIKYKNCHWVKKMSLRAERSEAWQSTQIRLLRLTARNDGTVRISENVSTNGLRILDGVVFASF